MAMQIQIKENVNSRNYLKIRGHKIINHVINCLLCSISERKISTTLGETITQREGKNLADNLRKLLSKSSWLLTRTNKPCTNSLSEIYYVKYWVEEVKLGNYGTVKRQIKGK